MNTSSNLNTRRNTVNAAKRDEVEKESFVEFLLVRINFILMAAAVGVIILGFLLMLGGSSSTESFNPDIYSARRIVAGPTLAFLGFIFLGFGIIYRPRKKEEQQ